MALAKDKAWSGLGAAEAPGTGLLSSSLLNHWLKPWVGWTQRCHGTSRSKAKGHPLVDGLLNQYPGCEDCNEPCGDQDMFRYVREKQPGSELLKDPLLLAFEALHVLWVSKTFDSGRPGLLKPKAHIRSAYPDGKLPPRKAIGKMGRY